MRPPLLSFSLLLSLVALAIAKSWSSDDLPNPQQDATDVCRRMKPSAVCDPDGYLSGSDADTIDGLINFIQAGTHGFSKVACLNRGNTLVGAQLAVAIFERMSQGHGDKNNRAYQFAKDLHDRWGVGDAQCQNGVVIVFAVKDRAMGFSIGKGVNGIFKDSMLPAVMDDMRPLLKEEAYGEAIIKGVTDVGNILSGVKPPAADSSDMFGMIAMLSVAGTVAALSSVAAKRKRRRYQQCKKSLNKIDRDRRSASENNYVITSCPICLEDFEPDQKVVGNMSQSSHASGTDVAPSADVPTEESERARLLSIEDDGQQSTTIRITGDTRDTSVSADVAEGDQAQRVRRLRCGHKFHESCLLAWASGSGRNHSLCPICRQPIDGEEEVEPQTNRGMPSGWDVYEPEYSFRMRRVQHYYPDFITWSMINDWHGHRHSYNQTMASSNEFTRVDPVVVAAAARSSGRGGSSFSFGGGSSAGGGGGGGGW